MTLPSGCGAGKISKAGGGPCGTSGEVADSAATVKLTGTPAEDAVSVGRSICTADAPPEAVSVCDAPDCCVTMTAREVYATAVINGMKVNVCSEDCLQALAAAEAKRTTCEGCQKPTSPEERHPTAAGGVRCASCELKLANAYGYALGAAMQRRGMGVVAGGRTVGLVRRSGPAFSRRSS